MKGYSTFSRIPGLKPHQVVSCHMQDTCWQAGSYLSAEMQTAYSITSAAVFYNLGCCLIDIRRYLVGNKIAKKRVEVSE